MTFKQLVSARAGAWADNLIHARKPMLTFFFVCITISQRVLFEPNYRVSMGVNGRQAGAINVLQSSVRI